MRTHRGAPGHGYALKVLESVRSRAVIVEQRIDVVAFGYVIPRRRVLTNRIQTGIKWAARA